jgi:hypothetical protein
MRYGLRIWRLGSLRYKRKGRWSDQVRLLSGDSFAFSKAGLGQGRVTLLTIQSCINVETVQSYKT